MQSLNQPGGIILSFYTRPVSRATCQDLQRALSSLPLYRPYPHLT